MRAPMLRASFLRPGEITVDNFAGGGGASTGIEAALGQPIDIAINHDAEAIAVHTANHPHTRHYQEDVWKVDPVEACAGRPVGLAWFSPTCTHFSKAKGAGLLDRKIRGLAWVVTRWAKAVRPRVIMLENVEEFRTWGALDENGRPVASKQGSTFRSWLSKLRSYGYQVEFRELVAADYGTPTTRKRLFLIARCDGEAITWPDATHGRGRAHAWRAASEIIDWTLPTASIFDRTKPLADATLNRIAMGVQKYVIGAAQPFIVRHGHYSTITGAGLREGCGAGLFRGQGIGEPLATVCATNDKHLVVPFVSKSYGGPNGHQTPGSAITLPLGTVTAQDHHGLIEAMLSSHAGPQLPLLGAGQASKDAQVQAFITKYYGANGGASQQSLFEPLHTITSKARFGLVTIHGEQYRIVDIRMRMLQPHELFAAQGFPSSYEIAPTFNGKPLTKTAQTRLAGNSVCPQMSAALVAANASQESVAAA